MKRILRSIPLLLLAGCATMAEGTMQKILLRPQEGLALDTPVWCSLRNEEGEWRGRVGRLVQVHRDGNPMTIECTDGGYSGVATTYPVFDKNGWLIVDLFTDLCLLTCLVDGPSNAFYSYPDEVEIMLEFSN